MPPTFRVSDWHLPSPSSTPKSATFPDASFQTPRTESFPSHFLDAWSTPRANVQHTPSHTPLYPRTGTAERPLSSYSRKSQDPEDPEFHINHYSPNSNLPLPPVEPGRRLASSPGPVTARQDPNDSSQPSLAPPAALTTGTMDTSQMQTPPPTRDASSSRKRHQDGPALNFSTPSTIYTRRDSAPAVAGNIHGDGHFGQTPAPPLFPSLQFTPDMTRFGNHGPATAPVPPQARLFWSQNTSGDVMNLGMAVQGDPFGFTPSNDQNTFQWQGFGTPANTSRVDSSSMPVADDSWTHTPAMLATTSADLQNVTGSSSSAADPFVATTSAVDPSMLFSFNGGPPSFENAWTSPQHPKASSIPGPRQPYEQQNRESQREKEMTRRSTSGQHTRTNTVSSSGSTADPSKAGLQRSNTHSGLMVRKLTAPNDAQSGSQGGSAPVNRKTSPLKRLNQPSLSAISEHTRVRPKTRLVVDEFGRARTETVREEGSPRQSVDHRTRYSGLWENDGSDSDEAGENYMHSQNGSFAVPSSLGRRNSKHGRTGSFLGRSQSVTNSRASSFSFSDMSRRLGRLTTEHTSGGKQPSRDESRRNSVGSSFGAYLRTDDKPARADGVSGENDGDAQDALKRVVEKAKLKRQETINAANVQKLEAHNQRWRASADMSRMNPSHGSVFDPFSVDFSATPSSTAAGDASARTPTTDRSNASSEGTRCACNSTEWDGRLMVQCESCTKWQHARCMGLPLKPELLPSVYVCIFCTGTTPVARGGRVRDPYRSTQTQPSPLSYKSTYRH